VKRLSHRSIAFLFLPLLAAIAAGCGSGSETSLPAPSIIAIDPAQGAAGVKLNVRISATFNQEMNSDTITTSTFQLVDVSQQFVNGTVTYDSSNDQATFSPGADLTPNTMYTVAISSAITSVADVPLPADVTWTFSTGQ